MSEREEKRVASGPLLFVVIALLVVLPGLYILSDGPAMGLEMGGYLPDGVYDTLYAPLIWAAEQWESVAHALNWYESCFYTQEMLQDYQDDYYSRP